MKLEKFFTKLNFSPVLFKKILAFVWLVFQNENKWILKVLILFFKKYADLHQFVTFRIKNYLKYSNSKILFLSMI